MTKKHKKYILVLTGLLILFLQACTDKSRNNVNFNEAAAESSVSPETEASPQTWGTFQVDDMDAIKIDENFSLEDFHIKNRVSGTNRYYIDENLVLWGYGFNDYGQLGIGTVDSLDIFYTEPIRIAENVVSVDYVEKKTDEMTMDEFLEKYGEPVMTDNDKDADAFCRQMEELKSTITNEALRKDFDHLNSNMRLARETHDVTYIRNVHEILHDMDYYLLRYGPTEMGSYVSDLSLVSTYYGVLEVYKAQE